MRSVDCNLIICCCFFFFKLTTNKSYHTNEKNGGHKCPDQIIGKRNPTASDEKKKIVTKGLLKHLILANTPQYFWKRDRSSVRRSFWVVMQ